MKGIKIKENEVIYLKINNEIFDLLQNDSSILYRLIDDLNSTFLLFPFLRNYDIPEIKRKLSNFLSFHITLYKNDCHFDEFKIFVPSLIGSGAAINFVNVEKGIIKNLEFSSDAPYWRKVGEGLNIFGNCIYPKCKVFGKEVIYITNLKDEGLKFNLNEEIQNIKCPICKKIMKPKTCGFWKCEYQFDGKKIEEGEVKSFKTEPKETKGDNFEYFDPFENDEVQWLQLEIYVLPKQKIKYKNIK